MVICSDGLDRGDPALLESAMERLSRLCHRVVWLNPHAGSGAPPSLGMAVAAPYVDEVMSAQRPGRPRGVRPRPAGAPVIRLGSLAGYPFEGPRVLAGWTPPAVPAVYVVLYRPDPDPRAVRRHLRRPHRGPHRPRASRSATRRAPCWIQRAGNKYAVHVATYEIPGGLPRHREQIVEELCAVYQPQCNDQQFDRRWQDHWIGSYDAPTTGPLSRPAGSPARVAGAGRPTPRDDTGCVQRAADVRARSRRPARSPPPSCSRDRRRAGGGAGRRPLGRGRGTYVAPATMPSAMP